MTPHLLRYDDAKGNLNWQDAVEALRQGHHMPRANISDLFLGPKTATLLNRAAYIDRLGYGVKAMTVVGPLRLRGTEYRHKV